MKLYHFGLIFAIFALAIFISTELILTRSAAVAKDETNYGNIFDEAVDAATNSLMSYKDGVLSLDKDAAADAFYASLYASFGITDNPTERAKMSLYVPVLAVTCDDGFYIQYNQILVGKDGHQEINRTWTNKIQYGYDDGYFIYRFTNSGVTTIYDTNGLIDPTPSVYKVDISSFDTIQQLSGFAAAAAAIGAANWDKCLFTNPELFNEVRTQTIAQTLERYLNEYCNAHNDVAQRTGILYQFSLPAMDSGIYLRAAANSSFLAFFQGYPMAGTNKTYNVYNVSNAQVSETQLITMDNTGVYHREGCTHIGEIVGSAYNERECVEQGYYACPYCYPNNGAHKH